MIYILKFRKTIQLQSICYIYVIIEIKQKNFNFIRTEADEKAKETKILDFEEKTQLKKKSGRTERKRK